jgi:NAD(P)-dependent dehydrogenase (short-subunit alcohol dehydrogenase family)
MIAPEGFVVVTGAASGIGRSIAQRFFDEGRSVVGIDIVEHSDGSSFPLVKLDLANTSQLLEQCRILENGFGSMSALVNVAGIYERIDPSAFSLDAYQRVLTVDLHAPILLSVGAAELMAQRGFGRIVNVTSIHGEFGERGGLAYDTAKAGLNQATRTLALEYSSRGVLFNAVAPGYVETAMSMIDGVLETTTEEFLQTYIKGGKLPIGRPAQPNDISGLVSWLCSADNTYVTGQVIRIDGGLTSTF